MKRRLSWISLLLVVSLILAACGGGGAAPAPTTAPAEAPTEAPTEAPVEAPAEEATEAPAEEAAAEEEATEEPAAGGEETTGAVTFVSTQFTPIEEQEKFRAILQQAGFDFTASEEGPFLDLILAEAEAGTGTVDVVATVHGTFPPLQRADALMNMIDIADDLGADREFAAAFLETGLLGTEDTLYYVPWLQATYIMAAHKDALEYLPEGADLNTLTWEQLGQWCQTLAEETGSPKCGLPHAGLFHRFLQGYLFPSFTGGMVSNFKSAEAEAMFEWVTESLWPYIHPQSISYEFMQEPLLTGEVWVAFDHTARLIEAFNTEPENFVGFPAPAGPAGRGFMPVIVGLGIPNTAPNPEGAVELIDYLTQPETQARILNDLAFFPVVSGVSTEGLPEGVAIEAAVVELQANSPDALPALLPVGLGDRGGEINQIYRNVFDRIVIEGEDIRTVLDEEGANLQALMEETGAPCWAPDPPSDGPCPVN